VTAKLALLLAVAPAAVALTGCSGAGAGPGGGRTVVATTTQAADLARHVAGGRAEVTSLLKPNTDPHGYEPRTGDVKALVGADLVLRSGGEIDDWLEDARRGAGSDAPVVTLGRDPARDPHWWQDPRAAIAAVPRIRDALAGMDAGGRAQYAANARRYLGALGRLDRGIAQCIATVPPARRKLVTTHDALGGFARRYGLRVIATVIPSRSTRGQASAGETAQLVRTIRRERVPAVFAESSVRSDVELAIAREAGARVAPSLWADSLGPEGSSGATYIASMAANARTIAAALGGDVARCPQAH
jgi:zinc/manganese transport system substrate-binding protein